MTSSFFFVTTLNVLYFAFGCVVLGVLLLLAGRSSSRRRGLITSVVVLALLLGSTLTAVALSSQAWLPLAALTAVWGFGLLAHQMLSQFTLSFVQRVGEINFLALLLFGLGVGSPLAWSQWQERQIQEYDGDAALLAQIGASQRHQKSGLGLTDRGRAIPLSGLEVEIDVAGLTAAEDRNFAALNTQHKLVRTALPDPVCNCHGWVFADGRYWVDGDEVQKILEDNGYYPVITPEVGDLIVYFAGDEALHSGIVRFSDADGTILVESKWGMHSRVLHAPEDQPHWRDWQFYHTSRKDGHTLRLPSDVVPSKPAASPSLLTANDR